jgi:hypothetical protein
MNEYHEIQLRKRRSREQIEGLDFEYEASGSRVSDFCRHHHLKPSVLRRHLKMGRWSKVESKEAKGLVAVALVGAKRHEEIPSKCALTVVLSSRRRIEVWPDFDSHTLERPLEVLERV